MFNSWFVSFQTDRQIWGACEIWPTLVLCSTCSRLEKISGTKSFYSNSNQPVQPNRIFSVFFWLEIIRENFYTGTFLSIPVTHVFHSIRISNACSNRWNTFQNKPIFKSFFFQLIVIFLTDFSLILKFVRCVIQNNWLSKWKNYLYLYIPWRFKKRGGYCVVAHKRHDNHV